MRSKNLDSPRQNDLKSLQAAQLIRLPYLPRRGRHAPCNKTRRVPARPDTRLPLNIINTLCSLQVDRILPSYQVPPCPPRGVQVLCATPARSRGRPRSVGLSPRYGSAPRFPPLCSPPGGKGSPREKTAAPPPRRSAARFRSAVAVIRLQPEAVFRSGFCAPAPRPKKNKLETCPAVAEKKPRGFWGGGRGR